MHRLVKKQHKKLKVEVHYGHYCEKIMAYIFFYKIYIQWNLSITDTLGPEKQFVVQRFPLFRGYLR